MHVSYYFLKDGYGDRCVAYITETAAHLALLIVEYKTP